jgi:hypothetical protein
MPSIRSLTFKHHTHVIALILLLNEIMPTYSHYAVKRLIYIIIVTLSS